ncbi:putative signal peptide protein [Halorubrum sp. AJ67]|nr:putative signal peptide protein [Halorubrum sp. AJ67]
MSASLIAMTAAVPVSAHPPNSTDHGVPEETFHKLWSGDRDNTTDGANLSTRSAVEQLGKGTDIPFDSPPQAAEQWNRGDHQEFPSTNRSVSIHPSDSNLDSGQFIKEAYAEVFAVQPSTRARLSPSRQPLYVAPNGTLRGTIDYRVAVPPDDTSGDRRVYWSLESHQVEETVLLVNGSEETTAGGSHTPALSYSLGRYAGEKHQFTLQADISVRLRKEVEICTTHNDDGDCTSWQGSVSYPAESVTVTDSIAITEYDLEVSGFIAEYPNDDLGLVVYKNQPWLGYQLPNGDVRGVWRFYSTRDTDWDTLVYSSNDGQRTAQSPLQPLQVNAYPIETGPTPSPRQNVTILDVYGTSTSPPTLPSNIHLDVLTDQYTASYGIATRATTDEQPETVRAWGLVRGVRAERPADEFAQIQISESNLTLEVVNQTENTVTVRVTLQNANTGAPINTNERGGEIVVNGQQVNTSGNGTVTTTIERPPGGVSTQYEPGHWWLNSPGYASDSDTVLLQGSVLRLVSTLFRIGVPVSLFLLAVFLIDRITGWRIWPPWRSL